LMAPSNTSSKAAWEKIQTETSPGGRIREGGHKTGCLAIP
jgi:hypothetical protein